MTSNVQVDRHNKRVVWRMDSRLARDLSYVLTSKGAGWDDDARELFEAADALELQAVDDSPGLRIVVIL